MSDDAIMRTMRNTSDEELLAITSGAAMGYTDQARVLAEGVLRERRVQLPADLKELRKHAATAEAEADRSTAELDTARDRVVGRALGIRLIVLGVGAFVLPIFGLQFRVLRPLGLAIPVAAAVIAIAGYILVVQTSGGPSQGAPHDEGRR